MEKFNIGNLKLFVSSKNRRITIYDPNTLISYGEYETWFDNHWSKTLHTDITIEGNEYNIIVFPNGKNNIHFYNNVKGIDITFIPEVKTSRDATFEEYAQNPSKYLENNNKIYL